MGQYLSYTYSAPSHYWSWLIVHLSRCRHLIITWLRIQTDQFHQNSVKKTLCRVRSSEASKNDSRTSGIPAALVRQMTAYLWFSHKWHWFHIFQTSDWYIQTSDFYNPLARRTGCIQFEISKPVLQILIISSRCQWVIHRCATCHEFFWLSFYRDPSSCYNIGYASETHHKLKSHDISFVHNSFLSCSIISKFCTEHGSDTAVLWTKFQNDWATEMDVMGDQDLSLRWVSEVYILYCYKPPKIPQRVTTDLTKRHSFHESVVAKQHNLRDHPLMAWAANM